MDEFDGGLSEVTRAAYVATQLVLANPGDVRAALNDILDLLLEQEKEDSSIIDWGTLEVLSVRGIDAETGEEYVDIGMGVQVLVPES